MGIWMGFAGAVANIAFLWALCIIGSTRISIFGMLQRPLVIVAASVILHEPLSWLQVVGVAMTLVGIQMANVKRLKKEECPPQGPSE
jgi:drug/metabolite transporter (DMT)-like permease